MHYAYRPYHLFNLQARYQPAPTNRAASRLANSGRGARHVESGSLLHAACLFAIGITVAHWLYLRPSLLLVLVPWQFSALSPHAAHSASSGFHSAFCG